jgi:hypothetical protein
MDQDMLKILQGLDAAEKGKKVDGTPSTAASEKNAMKALLEGLDAQQSSVNQMPATHKMAKATDTKHPASKYLVGGEEGEPEEGKEVVEDPTSEIRQGARVHIGHMTPGGSGVEGTVLKVEDGVVYIENDEGRKFKGRLKNTTLAEDSVAEDSVGKKQSFADIFKSMDEANAEKEINLEKELYNGIQKEKTLAKGDNGKFNLAEDDYNAQRLFHTLDKVYDNLLKLHERLDHGLLARQMMSMGFDGEQRAILTKLNDLMEEFDDILPGLEMQARGEN